MIRVIHGEIWSEDFTQLNDLIKKLPFDNIGHKKKYILVNKN